MTATATPGDDPGAKPPPAPQLVAVALACTLSRGAGSPIDCETIAVGPTGMRLTTGRPLAVDETVAFDLPVGEEHIRGQARVVCQERPHVYALRFGRLTQPMTRGLRDAMVALRSPH